MFKLHYNLRKTQILNMIQVVLLILFTVSSLLPPNADATLCIDVDSSIHMHLDECGTEIGHSEHSHDTQEHDPHNHESREHESHEHESRKHDLQENNCNDLKILCAISPAVVSHADVKIKLKNSSDIFSNLYIATFQKPDIKIYPTSLSSVIDIHTQEHLQQIKSIRLLI